MATTPHRFLVLHGWQNRQPAGHWQRLLAEDLAADGHQVDYPQLPDPDAPALKDWLGVIERLLAPSAGARPVVIAHSLSCMAWMHLATQGSVHLPVERVLLVAPPSLDFLAGTDEIREFQPPAGAHHAVRSTSMRAPRLVCGDDDPYCSPPAHRVYPGAFDVDLIPGAGHLDMVAGYGTWRSVRKWCDDPGVRLTAD
ncbi:RBBP9/YdeN family alpha/beta hydrolase [Actinoplanes sp. HUAS TT8]|uniref:RBBP9/YdeN family alpha/beta hydrolase n=1 Tax=Actinoplanes sp. HUAS TT8 TaxID=3447453 RepID=UPI003F51CB19